MDAGRNYNRWQYSINMTHLYYATFLLAVLVFKTGKKLKFSVIFNPLSPADQSRYMCKQCSSRRDGSVPSHQDLLSLPFCFWFFTEILISTVEMSQFKRWKSPFQKLRSERVNHLGMITLYVSCRSLIRVYLFDLFRFYVAFKDLSVISRLGLNVAGSSTVTFKVLPRWIIRRMIWYSTQSLYTNQLWCSTILMLSAKRIST